MYYEAIEHPENKPKVVSDADMSCWDVVYITSFYCVCSAILEVTRTWTWVEGSTPHQELIISNIPLDSHHKKPNQGR